MNSGDYGFCEYLGRTNAIELTWDEDNTVIDIDCPHDTCGFSDQCKLYQKRPVGFHQTFIKKP